MTSTRELRDVEGKIVARVCSECGRLEDRPHKETCSRYEALLYPEMKDPMCGHCGTEKPAIISTPLAIGMPDKLIDGALIFCGACGAIITFCAVGMRVAKPDTPLVQVPGRP